MLRAGDLQYIANPLLRTLTTTITNLSVAFIACGASHDNRRHTPHLVLGAKGPVLGNFLRGLLGFITRGVQFEQDKLAGDILFEGVS